MSKWLHIINGFLYKDFIFSSRYKVWRHIIYWFFHLTIWAIFWVVMEVDASFFRNFFNMFLWLPVFMAFTYPLVYIAIPQFLLQGKVYAFTLLILVWGIVGLYVAFAFRSNILFNLQQNIGSAFIPETGLQAHIYLCMTTSAAIPMVIKFFKLLILKQQDWLRLHQEKVIAELQLLKAQVHPHFLFNTLNNIYSFSLENSPKTAQLISKLSSLLNYMLYNCKTETVSLQKEIEVMKNYIDLEKERYGNRINLSWTVEGDMKDKSIAPLLLLPFLENAFKHGLSDQIEAPWLEVTITVKGQHFLSKISNSKNEYVVKSKEGIGIENVKKRLQLLYPNSHELEIRDEGNVFGIFMSVMLTNPASTDFLVYSSLSMLQNMDYETSLSPN